MQGGLIITQKSITGFCPSLPAVKPQAPGEFTGVWQPVRVATAVLSRNSVGTVHVSVCVSKRERDTAALND